MVDEKKPAERDTHEHMVVDEGGKKGRTPEHDHMVVDIDREDAKRHHHKLHESSYDE